MGWDDILCGAVQQGSILQGAMPWGRMHTLRSTLPCGRMFPLGAQGMSITLWSRARHSTRNHGAGRCRGAAALPVGSTCRHRQEVQGGPYGCAQTGPPPHPITPQQPPNQLQGTGLCLSFPLPQHSPTQMLPAVPESGVPPPQCPLYRRRRFSRNCSMVTSSRRTKSAFPNSGPSSSAMPWHPLPFLLPSPQSHAGFLHHQPPRRRAKYPASPRVTSLETPKFGGVVTPHHAHPLGHGFGGCGGMVAAHITTAGKTRSFIKTLLVGIAVFSSQCSQLNPQGNCGALGMMCPR